MGLGCNSSLMWVLPSESDPSGGIALAHQEVLPQEWGQHVSTGRGPERNNLDPREAMLVTMSPLSSVEGGG